MLQRYLIRQLLTAAVMAVALFGFVLVAGNALREPMDLLASERISWQVFGALLLWLVPAVVPLALPLGMLTAVLLVYGRLASQNEITAMKACGIGLGRIASPVVLTSLAGTVVSLGVLFWYEPMAKTQMQRLLSQSVIEDPMRFLEPRVFIEDFPTLRLYFAERNGPRVRGLLVWELDERGNVIRSLQASDALLTFDPQALTLAFDIETAFVDQRSTDTPSVPQAASLPFSATHTRLMLPLEGMFPLPQRKRDYLTFFELIEAHHDAETLAEKVSLQFFIQRRIAFAVGVLALALLGLPLAIKVGRVATHANIALALMLSAAYFLLVVAVSWAEDRPDLRPDLLIWLPNGLCFLLSAFLLRRASQAA